MMLAYQELVPKSYVFSTGGLDPGSYAFHTQIRRHSSELLLNGFSLAPLYKEEVQSTSSCQTLDRKRLRSHLSSKYI